MQSVPFTCCLIVFAMFIDEGNGIWKINNRKRLQEDIFKFQKMAEKVEEEIEDFYSEYAENWPEYEHFQKEKESSEMSNSQKPHDIKNNGHTYSILNNIGNSTNNITDNNIPPVPDRTFSENSTPKMETIKEIGSTVKENTVLSSKWPRFEDILQDMGKKYDWKNDRWIKVKKKTNQSNEENNLAFHERHKFSYKTVKLSKSNNRRNIVIAVTAVR